MNTLFLKKIFYVLLGILLLGGFFIVPIASAQSLTDGLVPCGRIGQPPCNVCDIFRIASNILNFILTRGLPLIFLAVMVYVGYLFLTSSGDPKKVGLAKDTFTSAIIGLALALGAYLLTTTLINTLAGDKNISNKWYKIECNALLPNTSTAIDQMGGGNSPPGSQPGSTGADCDPQALAKRYNEPYPRKASDEVTALVSCVKGKLPGKDLGSIATYDQSHDLCNYTRGQRVCGISSCSHAINSCHYGGGAGSQGAYAVDFGNEVIGDEIIAAANACGVKSARCETGAGKQVPCSQGNHVHVSTKSCDKN